MTKLTLPPINWSKVLIFSTVLVFLCLLLGAVLKARLLFALADLIIGLVLIGALLAMCAALIGKYKTPPTPPSDTQPPV